MTASWKHRTKQSSDMFSNTNKNRNSNTNTNRKKTNTKTYPWQQTTVPPLRVILLLLSSPHLRQPHFKFFHQEFGFNISRSCFCPAHNMFSLPWLFWDFPMRAKSETLKDLSQDSESVWMISNDSAKRTYFHPSAAQLMQHILKLMAMLMEFR